MITREGLLQIHSELSEKAKELMDRKNQDYGANSDPFRNFRMFGGLGILVRMSDKLSRLRTFEERGEFSVVDEGLEDTIRDMINYAILYFAYKKEESNNEKPTEIKPEPAKAIPTTSGQNPMGQDSSHFLFDCWCGNASPCHQRFKEEIIRETNNQDPRV